ncbi:MAG: sulfurtransferase [Vicinamibacteria bacterium]
MQKAVGKCALFAIAGCLLVAPPLAAAEGIDGNLVTAGWLEKNRGTPDVLILDASPPQLYAARHIPGALNVDFLAYGFPARPLADMEQRYQSWGISPGKKIVMYDLGGTYFGTRLMYSLYHHGFPAQSLFVLDGGLSKWQELGLPVTTDVPPPPAKGSFKIAQVREDVRVTLPEVLTASGDPAGNALVEALGPDWHFGAVAPFGRPGHIPNGVMLPAVDFFNQDKTFKSRDEIRRMAAYLGLRPEQRIHSYCGGGVAASVPFFALKFLLDYPKVALFPESEMGWLADSRELPYWTYDAPHLMRGTSWVQSWGGQMMRTYSLAKVSILDVRPAAAFGEGHLPFALNIPADAFSSNIGTPDKLAALLGPAGVDPSHEAVVVSGAGLTKEAALAFVLLEQLGQSKVSVLTDSASEWTKTGLKLATVPTAVGPKKGPGDLSIPPAAYPANVRGGVIVADAKSTQGAYPKLFVASGATVPAGAPDGKVVHVPYTDLLNADGTPKAAKDLWSTLTKAGVPRYAELVCYSDDPAEAAVNYFVLRLMGYPDVKVLAPVG